MSDSKATVDGFDDVPIEDDVEFFHQDMGTDLSPLYKTVDPVIKEGRYNIFNSEQVGGNTQCLVPPRQKKAAGMLTIMFFVLGVCLALGPILGAGYKKNDACVALLKTIHKKQKVVELNLAWLVPCGTDLLSGIVFIVVAFLNLLIGLFVDRESFWDYTKKPTPAPWPKLCLLGATICFGAFYHSGVRGIMTLILASLAGLNALALPGLIEVLTMSGLKDTRFLGLSVIPGVFVFMVMSFMAVLGAILNSAPETNQEDPKLVSKNLVTLLAGVVFPMIAGMLPFIIYLSDVTMNKKGVFSPAVTELWYFGAEALMYAGIYSQLAVFWAY